MVADIRESTRRGIVLRPVSRMGRRYPAGHGRSARDQVRPLGDPGVPFRVPLSASRGLIAAVRFVRLVTTCMKAIPLERSMKGLVGPRGWVLGRSAVQGLSRHEPRLS